MARVKRHDKMRQKLSELCDLLPYDDELKKNLDAQSILRLSLSAMRVMKGTENQGELKKCQEQVSQGYENILLRCSQQFFIVLDESLTIFSMSPNSNQFLTNKNNKLIGQSLSKIIYSDDLNELTKLFQSLRSKPIKCQQNFVCFCRLKTPMKKAQNSFNIIPGYKLYKINGTVDTRDKGLIHALCKPVFIDEMVDRPVEEHIFVTLLTVDTMTILYQDQRAHQYTNFNLDEVKGQSGLTFLHSSFIDYLGPGFALLFEKGESTTDDYLSKSRNGWIWIRSSTAFYNTSDDDQKEGSRDVMISIAHVLSDKRQISTAASLKVLSAKGTPKLGSITGPNSSQIPDPILSQLPIIQDPMAIPIQDPMAIPIQDPMAIPIQDPMGVPIQDPMGVPIIQDPMGVPIIQDPMGVPIQDPMGVPIQDPMGVPIIQDPMAVPIQDSMAVPIQDPMAVPIQEHLPAQFLPAMSGQKLVRPKAEPITLPIKVSMETPIPAMIPTPIPTPFPGSLMPRKPAPPKAALISALRAAPIKDYIPAPMTDPRLARLPAVIQDQIAIQDPLLSTRNTTVNTIADQHKPSPRVVHMHAPIQTPIEADMTGPIVTPIQTPMEAHMMGPIQHPIVAPIQTSMKIPIGAPLKTPIAAHIQTPIEGRMMAPIQLPIQTPIPAPMQTPIQTPLAAHIQTPIESNMMAPIHTTIAAPIRTPFEVPIGALMKTPIAAHIQTPIDAHIIAPIAAPIQAPMQAPIEGRMMAPIQFPIQTPIQTPLAARIQTPIVTPIEANMMAPIHTTIAATIRTPFEVPIGASMKTPIAAHIQTPIDAHIMAPMQLPIQVSIPPPIQTPLSAHLQTPIVGQIQTPFEVPMEVPMQTPLAAHIQTAIVAPMAVPIQTPIPTHILPPNTDPILTKTQVLMHATSVKQDPLAMADIFPAPLKPAPPKKVLIPAATPAHFPAQIRDPLIAQFPVGTQDPLQVPYQTKLLAQKPALMPVRIHETFPTPIAPMAAHIPPQIAYTTSMLTHGPEPPLTAHIPALIPDLIGAPIAEHIPKHVPDILPPIVDPILPQFPPAVLDALQVSYPASMMPPKPAPPKSSLIPAPIPRAMPVHIRAASVDPMLHLPAEMQDLSMVQEHFPAPYIATPKAPHLHSHISPHIPPHIQPNIPPHMHPNIYPHIPPYIHPHMPDQMQATMMPDLISPDGMHSSIVDPKTTAIPLENIPFLADTKPIIQNSAIYPHLQYHSNTIGTTPETEMPLLEASTFQMVPPGTNSLPGVVASQQLMYCLPQQPISDGIQWNPSFNSGLFVDRDIDYRFGSVLNPDPAFAQLPAIYQPQIPVRENSETIDSNFTSSEDNSGYLSENGQNN